MADLRLAPVQSGQRAVFTANPESRIVLDFPADQATLSRPEGSNSLVFQFADGGVIELQDFYTAYTKENMPEFEVEGQLVAGADFFNAFGPDISPAAGPGAGATGGNRYHTYGDAALADGLNHLDGLDWGMGFGGVEPDTLVTAPYVAYSGVEGGYRGGRANRHHGDLGSAC